MKLLISAREVEEFKNEPIQEEDMETDFMRKSIADLRNQDIFK